MTRAMRRGTGDPAVNRHSTSSGAGVAPSSDSSAAARPRAVDPAQAQPLTTAAPAQVHSQNETRPKA